MLNSEPISGLVEQRAKNALYYLLAHLSGPDRFETTMVSKP